MATSTLATIAGAIQKYLNKSSMSTKRRDYETPLANERIGVPGVIPKNSGQTIQFRYFKDFTPVTASATNDAPKIYHPDEEPAAATDHSAVSIVIPLFHIVDYVELSNFAVMTDPSNLLQETDDMLRVLVRRYIHRNVNQALVSPQAEPSGAGAPYIGTGSNNIRGDLATGFPTIYAGGGEEFSSLDESSLYSMDDFRRARGILENSGVPTFANGMYRAVISHSIKNQLMSDDAGFRDIVKRIESMSKEAFQNAKLPNFEGFDWDIQHDSYKTALPGVGGTKSVRKDSGRVDFAHVFGMASYGYAAIGGVGLKPKFKVQDITPTGAKTTIGFRLPFRASVINATHGLNIAGVTNFFQNIDEITG